MKKIITFILLLVSLLVNAQTYDPTKATTTQKPLGVAQQWPTDARSFYYDGVNFLWRPFQNTTEVLSYLNLSKYRAGNFIIVVDSGGTLQSNGLYLNPTNTFYMFKDSTTNAGLIKLNLFSTNGCAACLLIANNLSDLNNISTARTNLGLGTMATQNTLATGGDLTGNWPAPTVSQFNGQLPTYYLNYNNLSNRPSIPAQFNPTGLGLVSISGVYPNLVFTGATPGIQSVITSNNVLTADNTINSGVFNFLFSGTSAIGLPSGTTAQRPLTPSPGWTRFNTDSLKNETYNGTAWISAGTGGGGGGSGITALTGDGTASGTGSVPFTLATVNSSIGSFGTATNVATVTLNGKGQVTAGSNTPIQIAESQVTNLTADLAAKQATGNYITSLTTDIVAAGPGAAAATIQPNVVSYAKIQAAAGQGLMGATGAGNFGLITLGTNLSMTGSVLNATGGGAGAQPLDSVLKAGNHTKRDIVFDTILNVVGTGKTYTPITMGYRTSDTTSTIGYFPFIFKPYDPQRGNFVFAWGSAQNTGAPSTGRDEALGWGYNIDNSAPSDAHAKWQIESNWTQAGHNQVETYFETQLKNLTVYRPLFITTDKNDSSGLFNTNATVYQFDDFKHNLSLESLDQTTGASFNFAPGARIQVSDNNVTPNYFYIQPQGNGPVYVASGQNTNVYHTFANPIEIDNTLNTTSGGNLSIKLFSGTPYGISEYTSGTLSGTTYPFYINPSSLLVDSRIYNSNSATNADNIFRIISNGRTSIYSLSDNSLTHSFTEEFNGNAGNLHTVFNYNGATELDFDNVNSKINIADSVALNNVPNGSSADSVLTLGANHTIHKIGASNAVLEKLNFSSSSGVVVTNTTTETSIVGTGIGSATFAANTLATAGKTFRVRLSGNISTTTIPGNLTIKVKLGSNTITGVISNLVGAVTNQPFTITGIFVVNTSGTSGSTSALWTDSQMTYATAALAARNSLDLSNFSISITNTSTNLFDVTATWATASTGNIINGDFCTIEALN